MRLIGDMIEYCSKKSNNGIRSQFQLHMREAGCNAVQEVVFTIANGIDTSRLY